MSAIVYTAQDLLVSFYAASRIAGATRSAIVLNAASAAGMLLHEHGGPRTAMRAALRMPPDATWTIAAGYLSELVAVGMVEPVAVAEMGVIAGGGE